MRKIALLLAMLLLLPCVFISCNTGDAETTSVNTQTEPETGEPPVTDTPVTDVNTVTYPTVSVEYADFKDGKYSFSFENNVTSGSHASVILTSKRACTIYLNGMFIIECKATAEEQFFDISDKVSLFKKGTNTIGLSGARGSDLKLRLEVFAQENIMKSNITIGNKTGAEVARGLFGLNMEITRTTVFGGLSAQMLNNRKLFAASGNAPAGWECSKFTYVTDKPENSPCQSSYVILKDGGSMSITEDTVALKKGVSYEVSVWAKAAAGDAQITLSVDGGFEKSFTISESDEKYTKLSAVINSNGDVADGTFRIDTKGEAVIFEASLMPQDNYYGMRKDVIEALKSLHPASLRFPGGCDADHFTWEESLKEADLRKPYDGSVKGFLLRDTYGQDCCDMGINEFMMLCRAVGAEPQYTVRLVLNDSSEAANIVEYCNGSKDTVYGAKRQALGFDSFDVKLWYVGNEIYYFGYGLENDAVLAAERTNEYIGAMKQKDPSIKVCVGFVADANLRAWTKTYAENLNGSYDYISYHRYNGTEPTNEDESASTGYKIVSSMMKDDFDEGLEFIKNEVCGGDMGNVGIIIDEWNFCWGAKSNALAVMSNAVMFNFMARANEKYSISQALFFHPVNEGMIDVSPTDCRLDSSGELFIRLYPHMNGETVAVSTDNDKLDILCTEKDGEIYLTVINRSQLPTELVIPGYTTEQTLLDIGKLSWFNNSVSCAPAETMTLTPYGIMFIKLS